MTTVDHVRLNLPNQTEDLGIRAVGSGKCRRGIEKTRPRHNAEYTHSVRREGIAQGHIGCTLFMAAVNDPNFITLIVKRVEELIALYTGQGEDSIDAVGN